MMNIINLSFVVRLSSFIVRLKLFQKLATDGFIRNAQVRFILLIVGQTDSRPAMNSYLYIRSR